MRSTEPEMALLHEVLADFESKFALKVELIVLDWPTAWAEMLKYATYGGGPDVSLVGTTWVSPLCGMQALRPFGPAECRRNGGSDAHLTSIWNAGVVGQKIWALPWQLDTRVLFYWKSTLQRAGIDEATAFSDLEQLEHTVAALAARGETAIVGPTVESTNTLHNVASWVWSSGGDLMSPQADRVLFDQPESLKAIERYFALHRSLASSRLCEQSRVGMRAEEADQAFLDQRAAITVSGPWIVSIAALVGEAVLNDLGVAPFPGVPYNGGGSLIIWQRSLQEVEATALISYLTGPDVQRRLSSARGQLPARLDVLAELGATGDRFARVLSQNALRGQALSNHSLWGLVEERLTRTLGGMWRDVLDPAMPELRSVVHGPLTRLAAQLNTTLNRSTGTQ
ncbi:MAG TPA: extracellular solute-binding protein [Anaerolineales bacterium]|nr:extracellular solute-binding protein [Anaerolineales bacterium]